MNLYLVKRADGEHRGRDQQHEVVVLAEDVIGARRCASLGAGDEGTVVWFDSRCSDVVLLGTAVDGLGAMFENGLICQDSPPGG